MEELSYEAIAAALEMPIGTVKTHLHRARRRLREVLTEEPIHHGSTETRRKAEE